MKVVRAFFLCVLVLLAAKSWALEADVFSLTTNASVGIPQDIYTHSQEGYRLLPYYIRLRFPALNFSAWGIQIYTNNNAGTWTPMDGVYGGLRGTANPLERIPLYWQVYAEAQTNTISAMGLGISAQSLPYWGTLIDRSDYSVVNNWMDYNNLMNRTLVNYRGLGVYPFSNRIFQSPPVYIYLGMDVTHTLQAQAFQTTIRLDLYNLGISPSQGGYATPNPFTPVTGQRTNFNFFLQDPNSTFVVRIYSLRGRQLKAITDSREWDGRDEAGQLVEGGLYIYQIEAENQRISGTVVVIK